MQCVHASTHAHTCMRGAARPARNRYTAKTDVAKLLVKAGADINAVHKDRYVDVGRRGAVRTCGHVDAHVWTGTHVCFDPCCDAVTCAIFLSQLGRASGDAAFSSP